MGLIRTSKGTSHGACRAALSLKRDVGHWCVIRRARISTEKRGRVRRSIWPSGISSRCRAGLKAHTVSGVALSSEISFLKREAGGPGRGGQCGSAPPSFPFRQGHQLSCLRVHSAGVLHCDSSQRRKSFICTRCSIAGCLTPTFQLREALADLLYPDVPTQDSHRCATASYSDSAVTSTACSVPARSRQETRQVRSAISEEAYHDSSFARHLGARRGPASDLTRGSGFHKGIANRDPISPRFKRLTPSPFRLPQASRFGRLREPRAAPGGKALGIVHV